MLTQQSGNSLVGSLVESYVAEEKRQDNWRKVDLQARALSLRDALVSEVLSSREVEAQDPPAPQPQYGEALEGIKGELLQNSGKLIGVVKKLTRQAPQLEKHLQALKQFHQRLELWNPHSRTASVNMGFVPKAYMALYKSARAILREVPDNVGLQEIVANLEKVAQPLMQRLLPKHMEDARKVLEDVREVFEIRARELRDYPEFEELATHYKGILKYLNKDLEQASRGRSPTARLAYDEQGRPVSSLFASVISKTKSFLEKIQPSSKVASSLYRDVCNLERDIVTYNAKRISSSVRNAQNGILEVVERLSSVADNRLANTPPLRNLHLAWYELEDVDSEIVRTALTDITQAPGTEEEAEDLAEQLEDIEPDELATALDEVMERSSSVSLEAKGKKKKKKTKKKRKTKKKKKKSPSIADDPWGGKKKTFDSAYKKIDKARSQLAKLMEKISETSLVRGDVRYALSMLEKIIEAMRRS